jgi:hypothetical protein
LVATVVWRLDILQAIGADCHISGDPGHPVSFRAALKNEKTIITGIIDDGTADIIDAGQTQRTSVQFRKKLIDVQRRSFNLDHYALPVIQHPAFEGAFYRFTVYIGTKPYALNHTADFNPQTYPLRFTGTG